MMKNRTVLVKDFATFEGESVTDRKGLPTVNISGDITFLCRAFKVAKSKGKEIPADIEPLFERGMKYCWNSVYPFPTKDNNGEIVHSPNERPVVAILKKHVETDVDLRTFVKGISDNLPDNWTAFASSLVKSAREAFQQDKPAKSQIRAKKTEPKPNNDNTAILGQKVIDKFGDWESMGENDIKKLLAACKAYGTTMKAVRAIVDANRPEQEESADDFAF